MNTTCVSWHDRLLEAALSDGVAVPEDLENHLSRCRDCAAELVLLRARRERLDTLLPLMAAAAEPSPDLSARILTAAEAATGRRHRSRPPRHSPPALRWNALRRLRVSVGGWALAGAAAIVIAGMLGWAVIFHRGSYPATADLRGAQALAQWHAPTDALLETPGREFLKTIPSFGGSYMNLSPQKEKIGGK